MCRATAQRRGADSSQACAVREICALNVQAFEEASGRRVKYEIKPRRPGDAAAVWAATETAEKVLVS